VRCVSATFGLHNRCPASAGDDDFADLVPSDPGSITSDDERSDESDDGSVSQYASVSSSVTSSPSVPNATTVSAGEHEFQTEVRLSLDRAFSEGHSLENASVELKTLRMASNVPLRRVREAVVAGIVEQIPLVQDAVPQRVEIKKWVDRWGELINLIGGVDGVETVSILQVNSAFLPNVSTSTHYAPQYHCATSTRVHLFGQILAALYQNDIVEEEDIRNWHAQPEAKGEEIKDGTLLENLQKTWIIGARMIHQFNEQESDDEDESGSSEGEDDHAD
jgi:translation initiation factor eIF-2B subunit epsilon